jgi:hypothetical protein
VYAVYTPRLWHWPESWPLVSAVADGRLSTKRVSGEAFTAVVDGAGPLLC